MIAAAALPIFFIILLTAIARAAEREKIPTPVAAPPQLAPPPTGPLQLPATPTTADPRAAEAVRRIVESENPKAIAEAAKAAEKKGDPQLAAVLEKKAEAAKVAHPEARFASPFPSVPDARWDQFVRVLRGSDPKRVTAAGAMGLFGFTYARLSDLGVVRNLRKTRVTGSDGKERTVWIGDWVAPLSKDRFLGDAALQYEIFKRSTSQLAKVISKRYDPEVVGKTAIEGKPVTLSGLVAVAHRAGLGNLDKWLKMTPAERRKFTSSMEVFQAATGLW